MTGSLVTLSSPSFVNVHMFVDPGSKSTGWALLQEDKIVAHGTIEAEDLKDTSWVRLHDIYYQYYVLYQEFQFTSYIHTIVHFERMNYQVHYAVVHSVAAIAMALLSWGCEIGEEISPFAWQKTVGWDRKQKTNHVDNAQLSSYSCKSQDEAAAVGMALHFLNYEKNSHKFNK